MKKNLIVILGPTASGKTSLAARLAVDFHGEIISADSRQVYRGMDIGTGKDLSEFHRGGQNLPYHLIDVIDPREEFSVFEFQRRFHLIFAELNERQTPAVLVGGTGLYLESVLTDYVLPPVKPDLRLRKELEEKSSTEIRRILLSMKPDLHNKTDLEDKDRMIRKIEIEKARQDPPDQSKRVPVIHAGVFGLQWERDALRLRIAKRLRQRVNNGMIEEVSRLHGSGLSWERLDSFGLEYRYISRYLQNVITREEMLSKLQIAIGQFAKRQMTWFRRMERKGVPIEWIPGGDYSKLHDRVLEMLA
ncbi:MAG: tRNA (adenosine(37)-N6)-dimethylallyltransferase MiaA [Deltaproteobacteria bacterium]|nr:tRNA (adenosine(37)-N6)-dimethylallyltransferase MiaA [Deltaproteobacteria bacterium]